MTVAITQALAAQGQATSKLLGRGACFKCGQKEHFKRECPQRSSHSQVGRSKPPPPRAPDTERGIIGKRTVSPNLM